MAMKPRRSIACQFISCLRDIVIPLLLLLLPPIASAQQRYAIAIHGGAGSAAAADDPATLGRQRVLEAALRHGTKVLDNGGTSLNAVEQVIVMLEDEPLFNAGKGAVYNHVGGHELDASIMDGRDLNSGAVAGVSTVKNPIKLARLVMTETRHILLAGDGAESFGKDLGIDLVENSYFDTPHAHAAWQRALRRSERRPKDSSNDKQSRARPDKTGTSPNRPELYFGTVGCVALDQHGNLAAGTSTGGLTDKKFGRVGDSPIIGAGTYANNRSCAVSCTGTGERFIERAIAFDVSARMLYKNLSVDEAVQEIFAKSLPPRSGGLIAVSHTGEISIHFNTPGMSRARANSDGLFEVKVGK